MIKIGDKLLFNYGGTFPTKVGTVTDIVPSRYSKGGAFADVIIGKRKDGFAEITTADVGDIMKSGETTVNGSPIGVFLT